MELAKKIAKKSPVAVKAAIDMLQYYKAMPHYYEGVKAEANHLVTVFVSEDAKEGIQHLLKNENQYLKGNNKISWEVCNMNIYVLVKRTFDTEEKIVVSNGKIQEDGAEFIINPYDEYAIEEAIQVRDAHGGEVTVVTIGGEDAEKQLRTALAMGADKAVLINTEDDLDEIDQFTAAKIIAEYLKDKEADLILAGNVAIDGGSGQVGPRVAELLRH